MSSQQLTPRVTATGSGIGQASGFELASPDQPGAANVEAALERNRAFAAAAGHKGAVVFPNLRLFVITCLDPRVDPAHFLGLGLSDAMVIRNVGGRLTPEVINDVAFISQLDENVLPDVERLGSAPATPPRATVSGHVYDVVTGLVQTVIPSLQLSRSNR